MNSPSITWVWKAFGELLPEELYALLKLRAEVFIVEQDCAYLDLDDLDQQCRHLLGFQGGRLVAYLRLAPPGVKYTEASLGRVINAQGVRGVGIGKQLFAEGIREAQRLYPNQPLRIGAQRYLERFYGAFGFVAEGAAYLEDGIEHIQMVKPPS
jgi:ElaA protein